MINDAVWPPKSNFQSDQVGEVAEELEARCNTIQEMTYDDDVR